MKDNEVVNQEEYELSNGEIVMGAAIAVALIYLGYKGLRFVFDSANNSIAPETRSTIAATALSVTDIASRLKF